MRDDYFLVEHVKTREILKAYEENEKGFLHKVSLYPVIGIDGPPSYILKKPFWKRI
jgi:hypothetical protein